MAAIVTNKFRLNNSEQFYESFAEASTSFYLFVGRPQPWTSTTPFGGGTDIAPPTPLDNVDDEYMYFRDMLAAKRIAAADIQYAIPRHNWTTGTVYDYYRGDYGAQWSATASDIVKTVNAGTNLWASTTLFYVLSSLNNVYKCMWNNSGATSTVEPTGTSNSELTTADGYIWKYMYTLTTAQITDFLTADFMPVATNATVSGAAVNGAVRNYVIMAGGAGYTSGTYSTQTLRGDAVLRGGTAATFTVIVTGGVVTSVTAVGAGTAPGYTFADCAIDDISGIGTPSTSATVTPIIGPPGGHGYNAIDELGGFYVMTNTTISGTEGSGDFVVDQDFRRVGIVLNPYNYGTTTIATASTLNALKSMTFDASPTPGTFVIDEAITGGTSGAKGLVVAWDGTTRILKYIQTQWTGVTTAGDETAFAVAEVVTSASSQTGTIDSLTNPEIDYYSGKGIYVEDRAPISRATDQTENIKLIVEF